MALKVIRKIETIVREEMDRAGAQELLLPISAPAELWQESGRWEMYGKELLRFKDRHERDFCLGPTHEEIDHRSGAAFGALLPRTAVQFVPDPNQVSR